MAEAKRVVYLGHQGAEISIQRKGSNSAVYLAPQVNNVCVDKNLSCGFHLLYFTIASLG